MFGLVNNDDDADDDKDDEDPSSSSTVSNVEFSKSSRVVVPEVATVAGDVLE